jgi:hypothetical protein
MNLVVKIKFGSHLYGTDTPQSDVDYKSVYLPEARDIILQRVKDSVHTGKAKTAGEKNLPGDVDTEAFSLQRYLNLLAEGQTVAIDMLFAPKPEVSTTLWQIIYANRERLLTKRSAAFVGYCRTQANKYGIKGSRVAAAKAAMDFFEGWIMARGNNTKVGDVMAGLTSATIDQHTFVVTKEKLKGHTETYYVCCDRMVGFKNTLKEAYGIFSRIYVAYGDRARMAESNEGIDWKALSHAVRVGHEAIELLKYHEIYFPRPEAAHLLDIKLGKLAYKEVAEEIENLLEQIEAAAKVSTLRDEADLKFIDDFVYTAYRGVIAEEI